MIEKFAQRASDFVYPVCKYLDYIAWMAVIAMMLLTVANVLATKVFNTNILGSIEITELLMVICVFFSFANTEVEEGHISVDLLVKKLKPKKQAIMLVITQGLCAILFACVSWSSLFHAIEKQEMGEVTMDLLIPLYPFAYITALGCFLLCLVLIIKTIIAIDKVFKS